MALAAALSAWALVAELVLRWGTRRTRGFEVSGAVIAAGAAIAVGLGAPMAAAAAIAVPMAAMAGWLALTDFTACALLAVMVRPSLDLAKASADESGKLATVVALGILAAAVVWVPLQWRTRSWWEERWLVAGCVGLALAGGLSVVGAQFPVVAMSEALRLSSGLVMFVVLAIGVRSPRDALRALTVVFASSVLPLVVGLAQAAESGGSLDAEGLSRVRGTFTHPNTFGLYLALVLVLAVALLPRVHGQVRLLLIGLAGLYLGMLGLTYSRSAWAAALIGLVVVGWMQSRRMLISILVAPAVAALLIPSVSARVSDLTEGRSAAGGAGNSLVWRFDYWGETLPLARDNPFTGVGLRNAPKLTAVSKVLHNDYLRSYVEMGIVGVVGYVAFLAGLCHAVLSALGRARRRHETRWATGGAVGALGALGSFMVYSLGGNAMTSVVILWTLAAIVAAAVAGTRPDAAATGRAPVPVEAGAQ